MTELAEPKRARGRPRKTEGERFPGAVDTLCIESMMQDRKALQAGTSHYLGQNFSKSCNIQFQDEKGTQQYAHTTSWGVSTRLIGGMIMTHSDDDGFVAPPRLAPQHVVICPIYKDDATKADILAYCQSLQKELSTQRFHDRKVVVTVDNRDIRGGDKAWGWVKKGVPLRVEVGPRDLANNAVNLGGMDLSRIHGRLNGMEMAIVGEGLPPELAQRWGMAAVPLVARIL